MGADAEDGEAAERAGTGTLTEAEASADAGAGTADARAAGLVWEEGSVRAQLKTSGSEQKSAKARTGGP